MAEELVCCVQITSVGYFIFMFNSCLDNHAFCARFNQLKITILGLSPTLKNKKR